MSKIADEPICVCVKEEEWKKNGRTRASNVFKQGRENALQILFFGRLCLDNSKLMWMACDLQKLVADVLIVLSCTV